MAFYANGFKTITHMGTPDATAGSQRCLHSYVTNDDTAAVITTNYFLSIYTRLKPGDIILMSLDLDGTIMHRTYVVTVSSAASVVIAAQNVA